MKKIMGVLIATIVIMATVVGFVPVDAKATTATTVDPYQIGRDTYVTVEGVKYALFNDAWYASTGGKLTNVAVTAKGNFVVINWAPNMDFTTHVDMGFAPEISGIAGTVWNSTDDYVTENQEFVDYFDDLNTRYVAKMVKKYGETGFVSHIPDYDGNGMHSEFDIAVHCYANPNKAHMWYGVFYINTSAVK